MPAPRNAYDVVPYDTFPRPQTHPDRLAAVATLFGMEPAPLASCRVLEIGCGDGRNLIPMAYSLPRSRFTGIDLASKPVAAARATVEALGLTNLTLRAADLREIGPADGQFDYILAHGLYSWVPTDVRDCMLAVCRDRLTPQGVAFISYNVYPGRIVCDMLRHMMRYHARDARDAGQRIQQARWFLQFLRDGRQAPAAWQALLEEEAAALLEHSDGSLFHDDLSEINHPVYFHEFAAHARAHGLQYLGEADPHEMFDPQDLLKTLQGGLIEREQYLDFLKLRRFRQTLLCRQEIQLRRDVDAAAMDRFLFSSVPFTIEDGVIQGPHGARITIGDAAVENVIRALGDTHPLPVEFEELCPYAGGREPLREILFSLLVGGMVNLHVYDFPCEESVTSRPIASRLVRLQAAAGPYVTNACHIPVKLDEIARQLVLLMDGVRDHEALAQSLAAIPGSPPLAEIRRHLTGSLEWLARMALLEG